MQIISDTINASLTNCFPFIDCFYGFSKDVTIKNKDSKGKSITQTFPLGCNTNPDDCSLVDEMLYLLPESDKQGIVFYDNIKIVGQQIDLECKSTLYNYSFDIVVWINTEKVVFTNTEFCSDRETVYNHFVKCLTDMNNSDVFIISIGLDVDYYRTPWTFTDRVKYLNVPYIAFRIPMVVQSSVCLDDLEPLEYTIKDC